MVFAKVHEDADQKKKKKERLDNWIAVGNACLCWDMPPASHSFTGTLQASWDPGAELHELHGQEKRSLNRQTDLTERKLEKACP